MSKVFDEPVKKYVISFRVTEDERETLAEVAEALGLDISTLLRRACNLLEKNHCRWLKYGKEDLSC